MSTDAVRTPEWTVGDRLRKARESAGLEQGELADRIGISRNSVINYEKGHTRPRRIVLNAWSLVTGVPVAWLEGQNLKMLTPTVVPSAPTPTCRSDYAQAA